VAGNGVNGFNGGNSLATRGADEPAARLAVDSANNLYIADYDNHRIRKVVIGGNITTVAGHRCGGYFGDVARPSPAR